MSNEIKTFVTDSIDLKAIWGKISNFSWEETKKYLKENMLFFETYSMEGYCNGTTKIDVFPVVYGSYINGFTKRRIYDYRESSWKPGEIHAYPNSLERNFVDGKPEEILILRNHTDRYGWPSCTTVYFLRNGCTCDNFMGGEWDDYYKCEKCYRPRHGVKPVPKCLFCKSPVRIYEREKDSTHAGGTWHRCTKCLANYDEESWEKRMRLL